ncbi:growth factor receptor-bound protein 14-like [Rhopilema esculentum]|uniref:growth factor receptor-bound protein 14-like n=1 Tax=Rhopilema esculentum TaxID=499914 RepID=UPI0031DD97DB|eukprot:gene14869-5996_t
MALEEDIAELNSVLDDLNSMMKDISVQTVLEFFPSNNNETFKDILTSEMDTDGPAGRLLRTLSKDEGNKSLLHANNISKSNEVQSVSSCNVNSSCNHENDQASSVSSNSFSIDETIVDLAYCSEGGSHTRPNSIVKLKSECSSETSTEYENSSMENYPLSNGKVSPEKLHVTVFFQERPIDLEIPFSATAKDIAHRIIIINRLQRSQEWTIFECLTDYDLERNLEDHELIKDVVKNWPKNSENRLQMKNFTKKYECFEKPAIYFPSYLLCNDETTKTATLRADEQLSPEYASYFMSDNKVPQLENFLHLKEYRKKTWKRKYCLLKASGIFSSSKSGFKRSSREVKCNVEFEDCKLFFTTSSFKGSQSAPFAHCFCFVPDNLAFHKDIKCFCAENEQVMQSWVVGFRLAKFGSRLYRNYKIATQDNRAAKTVSAPVDMDSVIRRKRPSIDYRVPIDFSGNASRVVSDPDAAKAVINSISSKLPKRLKRRSTGSFHSPYSSGVPAVVEKPWFHGKLEREQAAKLLRSGGLEEGLFLVRESCTSAGVHVISLVKKKKILHHQVFKAVGEGQVFYGLEHGPRFQSLEQLIEFYQNYRHAGKPPLLRKACKRIEK